MFLNMLSIPNTVAINALKKDKPGDLVQSDQKGNHSPGNKTPEIVVNTI